MIKGVVFDFRGTLLEVRQSRAAGNRALFLAMKKYKPLRRLEFDQAMDKAVADVFRKYGRNTEIHDWNIHFIKRLLFLKNVLIPVPELERLAKIYHHAFAQNARLYPEVKMVLETLRKRKIKLGIVIDGTEYRERLIIRRLKLKPYFSSIIISETVGKNKFTPQPLKRAVGELKLKPREILVVGDRIDKDIIHANRLGCVSVKLERKAGRSPHHRFASSTTGKTQLVLERPTYVIRNLKQLIPLL